MGVPIYPSLPTSSAPPLFDTGQPGESELGQLSHQFWERRVEISDGQGERYSGSYGELFAMYPEMRDAITHCFEEWEQEQSTTASNSPQVEVNQPDGSAFGIREASSTGHSQTTQPTIAGPSASLDDPSTSIRPLEPLSPLVAVTKQTSVRHEAGCIQCGRDVVVNGNNDGKHCTRCFNNINKARAYQRSRGVPHSSMHLSPDYPASWTTARSCGASASLLPIELPNPTDRNGLAAINTSSDFGGRPTAGQLLFSSNDCGSFTSESSANGARLLTSSSSPTPKSANTQANHELDSSVADPSNVTQQSSSEFDLEHESVEVAHAYITRPKGDDCERLNIENDDWQSVKNGKFKELCCQLFNSLSQPPPSVARPDDFDDRMWAYFEGNHQKAFKAVLDELQTAKQIKTAKARVIIALDEVVSVHRDGIPGYLQDRTDKRTRRGYPPETTLTCGMRARKVIENVASNKYLAQDILQGKNLADIARSPTKYLERKRENAQTNAVRSKALQDVKDLKSGEKTRVEIAQEPARKRGRKSKQPVPAYPTADNLVAPQQRSASMKTAGTAKRRRSVTDDEDHDIEKIAKRARLGDVDRAIPGGEAVVGDNLGF